MPFDPTSLEADLRRIRAASLDRSLLERLDACIESTWTELNPAEANYEQSLRETAPAKLSPTLMAALEATLHETPFLTEKTILHFPQKEVTAPRYPRRWWAAAAAVALTGAVTALLVPMAPAPSKLAIGESTNSPIRSTPTTRSTPTGGELIPAGFNRGLSEASDQGVIWQSNQQPHRVLKVVYKERVTCKGAAGQTYQMEQPRVEYYLIPAKTD